MRRRARHRGGAGRPASARARHDLRPRPSDAWPLLDGRLPAAAVGFAGRRAPRAALRRALRGIAAAPRRLFVRRGARAAREEGYRRRESLSRKEADDRTNRDSATRDGAIETLSAIASAVVPEPVGQRNEDWFEPPRLSGRLGSTAILCCRQLVSEHQTV